MQQSNFFEILLREICIGMTVYDNDGNPIVIAGIEYQPATEHVLISNADESVKVKMDIKEDFMFEYPTFNRKQPNKKKIKGEKTR